MVYKSECGDISSPGILQFSWVRREIHREVRGKKQVEADIKVGDRKPLKTELGKHNILEPVILGGYRPTYLIALEGITVS